MNAHVTSLVEAVVVVEEVVALSYCSGEVVVAADGIRMKSVTK